MAGIGSLTYKPNTKTANDIRIYYNLGTAYIVKKYSGATEVAVHDCNGNAPAACPAGDFSATVTLGGNLIEHGSSPLVLPIGSPRGAALEGDITPASGSDEYEVWCLPDTANDVLICYEQGFTADPGIEQNPVPRKYDPVDHYIKVRPETSISMTDAYVSNWEGIQAIRGRIVTLICKIFPEDSVVPSEVKYYTNCQMSIPTINGDGDGTAPMQISATGQFNRFLSFSANVA